MQTALKENALAGKTALISGGTSGINQEIASGFVALGAQVAVFGRDAEKAKKAADAIAGGRQGAAIGLSADVRDAAAVKAVVDETVSRFGPIDIVVAGAAGNFPAPAIDISPNGFKAVVDIDLLGTYNVFRLAFDHLRTPGANLIAITAPQAVDPTLFQAHVCAAKAGINMLIKCLALEWGPAGVRVAGISPGPIAGTEGMARLAPTPEMEERAKKAVAMRRFGEKAEIAELAAFLSSEGARYMTGAIYNCDGGCELGDAGHDALTSWKKA